MVMGSKRQHSAVYVQFDVPAKDIPDRTVRDKICNPPGASQISISIVNNQTSWQEEITREEQSGLAVVIRNVRRIMAGGWNYIDYSITKIYLSEAVRPI